METEIPCATCLNLLASLSFRRVSVRDEDSLLVQPIRLHVVLFRALI
jgi:hypothetical protein